MKLSSLQERFSSTISIILKYWKNYLLFNLLTIVIWLVVFFILLFIFIFLGLSISSFRYAIYGDYGAISIILILIFLVITLAWILNSTLFLGNFYITKAIYEEKDIPGFKKLYSVILSNLGNKIKVDFWFFLLWIPFIVLLTLLVIFIVNKMVDGFVVSFIMAILFIYYIYIFLHFFLSYYFTFDNKKFTFKDFLDSRKIIEGKKLEAFGNIIVIIIFTSIIGQIFILLFSSVIPSIGTENISTIIFIVFKYMLNLFVGIFSFVYFYLYYLYLSGVKNNEENNGENNEEKDDEIEIEK